MRRIALLLMVMMIGIQGIALAGVLDSGLKSLGAAPLAFAIQSDRPSVDVTVETKTDAPGEATFSVSPIWLAIGGLAVVVLVVLIAMAMRGGSSTVVKAD